MLCLKCGALIGEHAAPTPVSCRRCDDLAFDRAVALGVYGGALAASVVELKKAPFLDAGLRRLMANSKSLRQLCLDTDLIVPVPLSTLRRDQRGFNQAEVIAKALGHISGCTVETSSLIRTRHTPMHRIGMDSKARRKASLKAFAVSREGSIRDKTVLLVDDVMTSGATASACADILKSNGSHEVNVFTLARAVMR